MEAAAKGNKELEMAAAEYKKLTWGERRRLIAEEREKARRDKVAMLHYAWNEGRSMEREQILGLLDRGMSLEELKRRLSGLIPVPLMSGRNLLRSVGAIF